MNVPWTGVASVCLMALSWALYKGGAPRADEIDEAGRLARRAMSRPADAPPDVVPTDLHEPRPT